MNKIFLYERFSGVLKTTETEKGGASGFATADFPLRLKPKTRVGSLEEVLLFTKEDIEKGLENNEFEVHYQPIIDLQNNTVISGEALVRWNTPKYGMLFPKSFISIAEDTGAIYALGEFVLRSACAQSVKWKMQGYFSYFVTVNISMLQLADINFVATVFRIMKEEGIAPHELELEITESLAMVDPEKTRKVLYALQEIGVRILLDDFGSGYSSLNHLRQFPVYGLKIDNQFIQHAVRSKKDQNLMHSIVLLARTLDLDVVAEGVETEEQLELLKSMGCSFVQGYYFTQPLPAVEYREWCENFTERPI